MTFFEMIAGEIIKRKKNKPKQKENIREAKELVDYVIENYLKNGILFQENAEVFIKKELERLLREGTSESLKKIEESVKLIEEFAGQRERLMRFLSSQNKNSAQETLSRLEQIVEDLKKYLDIDL